MTAKLWICTGYWRNDEEPLSGMVVCDGEWDGTEDAVDERIFFYTDGEPVVGKHSDFVITEAVECVPEWWTNKQAGVAL